MIAAPRRVAIGDTCDPGLRRRLRVFVDGDLLRDIVAYDADEGWVMAVRHDECGCRMMNGDCYVVGVVFGDVRVFVA